jgi:hypothetical protein
MAALCALGLPPAEASGGAESDGLHATPSLHWTAGEHRMDIGLSSRFRSEAWDAFADDREWFSGTRSRLRLQYGFQQKLFVVGEFQDVRLHGMDADGSGALALYRSGADGASHASGQDVRQLYVEARFADTSFLRMGRQDLKVGQEVLYPEANWRYLKGARVGERLVGTVGWSHVERAYDGVAGSWGFAGAQLDGFFARPTTGVFDAEHAYSPLHDVTIGGASLTAKRGTLFPASELSAFALAYRDDRPQDRGGLADDVEIATLGAHWLGVYPVGPGNLDLLVWVAGQLGDYARLDHAASAGILELGYQLPALPARPWLRVGMNAASGDDEPADGDHDTFFNLLPTNHLYYGFADQLAFQNLRDWFVQLRAAPHEKVTLNLFVHWFALAEADDSRYGGTGAFDDSTFGFAARSSRGHEHVGREYDVVATVALHSTTTVELGYSRLDGGAMFRTSPDRDLDFFYATLEFRY